MADVFVNYASFRRWAAQQRMLHGARMQPHAGRMEPHAPHAAACCKRARRMHSPMHSPMRRRRTLYTPPWPPCSAFESSMEALEQATVKVVAVIAEGVPEKDAKTMIAYARANSKVLIGPATVGGVQVRRRGCPTSISCSTVQVQRCVSSITAAKQLTYGCTAA